MVLKQVLEISDLLESPRIDVGILKKTFLKSGLRPAELVSRRVKGKKGETQFVKVLISGKRGKSKGKPAPTLGIIGRLGGIGARPYKIGLVSDADGAITALASALKITEMRDRGDAFDGDVIVATHLSPSSPIIPHEPVPFMDAPVSMAEMNRYEVDQAMDAILSIDTTKGNRIINQRGFAISPTVRDGYILRVSEDLLDIMQNVTGRMPVVFPVTIQDITPYGNGVYHLNSIMQPATATHAPVVGVAITAEVAVPGCATGANHPLDIEMAARFCAEAAKAYAEGRCAFYDEAEFQKLVALYGTLECFKTFRRSQN
ncbi:MAG: DUF1177 domain-containing protein [Acidobacteriota bacterium]